MAGHQYPPDAELFGKRAGMQWAPAAKRQQRESTRIVALPDRYQADAFRHLRIDDAVDAEGGLLDREIQGARNRALDCFSAELGPELEAAAGEVFGIQIAEDDGGIGQGRLVSAAAVAGGPGLGAGRLRPNPQAPSGVEPRNRTAARPDRVDVEHAHAHRIATDAALRAQRRRAIFYQRDIARRATDIDGYHVAQAGGPAHHPRPDHAGSRTGEEKPNRPQPRRGRGANSAARLHDLKGCGDRRGEETGIQIGEIAVDHGFNIGIKRRDDSALVFAEGRIDLGRERDEYVRMTRRDDLASAALVPIIEK